MFKSILGWLRTITRTTSTQLYKRLYSKITFFSISRQLIPNLKATVLSKTKVVCVPWSWENRLIFEIWLLGSCWKRLMAFPKNMCYFDPSAKPMSLIMLILMFSNWFSKLNETKVSNYSATSNLNVSANLRAQK